MTNEEFEKILEKKGYIHFDPSPIKSQRVLDGWQKRFTDAIGTKYFINVYKWESWTHPYTGSITPATYEFECQFTYCDNAVNFLFHCSWELDEVEKKIEETWKTGVYDYYDMFYDKDYEKKHRSKAPFEPHETSVGARIDWMNGE